MIFAMLPFADVYPQSLVMAEYAALFRPTGCCHPAEASVQATDNRVI
jgi:hypothetical protein